MPRPLSRTSSEPRRNRRHASPDPCLVSDSPTCPSTTARTPLRRPRPVARSLVHRHHRRHADGRPCAGHGRLRHLQRLRAAPVRGARSLQPVRDPLEARARAAAGRAAARSAGGTTRNCSDVEDLFDEVIAERNRSVSWDGDQPLAAFVSGNYFEMLGGRVQAGRSLADVRRADTRRRTRRRAQPPMPGRDSSMAIRRSSGARSASTTSSSRSSASGTKSSTASTTRRRISGCRRRCTVR